MKTRPRPAVSGDGRLHSQPKQFSRSRADLHEDFGIDAIKALNTLFTDSEVVKTWETSGSKVMTSRS